MIFLSFAQLKTDFQLLNDILDALVPIKSKTIFSNDKPWITPQFRALIARRQKAFLSGDHTRYKQLRNQVNREKESLAPSFYRSSVDKLANEDSRGWWKTVKTLLGLHGKSDAVQTFANNSYGGDIDALIADINDFLASVSSDLTFLFTAPSLLVIYFLE